MPRLQVQLEKASYSPGETVRAWARAIDGGDSRAGMALLRYVERTEDYEEVAWHKMVRLWNGDITAGQSFAFEFELPPDAKPGQRSPNGSVGWDVLVRSDEFGRDSTASQPLEVIPPPDGYAAASAAPSAARSVPAFVKPLYYGTPVVAGGVGYAIARIPGAVGGVLLTGYGAVMDWRRRATHFELEPPRPVRRGERVRATVRMIDAAKMEGELEAELECIERYDYLSHSGKSSSRQTKEVTLHVERVPLGVSGRSVDIEVPAQLPFTHAGSCMSYAWKLIVREKRDNATDRIAEQSLLVLP